MRRYTGSQVDVPKNQWGPHCIEKYAIYSHRITSAPIILTWRSPVACGRLLHCQAIVATQLPDNATSAIRTNDSLETACQSSERIHCTVMKNGTSNHGSHRSNADCSDNSTDYIHHGMSLLVNASKTVRIQKLQLRVVELLEYRNTLITH